jgi:hypothetical protein
MLVPRSVRGVKTHTGNSHVVWSLGECRQYKLIRWRHNMCLVQGVNNRDVDRVFKRNGSNLNSRVLVQITGSAALISRKGKQ